MDVFKQVKERVSLMDAIKYLDLKATDRDGDQMRFNCPSCKDKEKRGRLAVHIIDGFTCYNSGKVKGNDATGLVAHCKGIRQREAAQMLADHFLSSSTEARGNTPAEARGGTSKGASAPLDLEHPVMELLGITPGAVQALGGGFSKETERIHIPLRLPDGTAIGCLKIATKADQSPLLEFPEHIEQEQRANPDELRRLFRVVS